MHELSDCERSGSSCCIICIFAVIDFIEVIHVSFFGTEDHVEYDISCFSRTTLYTVTTIIAYLPVRFSVGEVFFCNISIFLGLLIRKGGINIRKRNIQNHWTYEKSIWNSSEVHICQDISGMCCHVDLYFMWCHAVGIRRNDCTLWYKQLYIYRFRIYVRISPKLFFRIIIYIKWFQWPVAKYIRIHLWQICKRIWIRFENFESYG